MVSTFILNTSVSDQVPEDVRQARRDALISQQQDISQSFAESLVGREVGCLFSCLERSMSSRVDPYMNCRGLEGCPE